MSGELIIAYDDGAKHETVSVAGEFSGWNPSRMQLESGTKYVAKFTQDIHAGHDYMYKFVVDGEWKLLDGHTTRTDVEGHVNHSVTATIVGSAETPAATIPGVVPVAIHKEGAGEHRNLDEIREHDRQRALYLSQQMKAAEQREPVGEDEERAKMAAGLGSVNEETSPVTPGANVPGAHTATPKNNASKEREDASVRDIYEESDIPPATDPDSTIGSAYTPDQSWSSPARANAEVVGPSGVSTPPRTSRATADHVSDVTISPESKGPTTPTSKTAASAAASAAPASSSAAAATPATAASTTSASAKGASASTPQTPTKATAPAAATTPTSAGSAAAAKAAAKDKPSSAESTATTPAADKKEKPAKQRSSFRKFFRKLID